MAAQSGPAPSPASDPTGLSAIESILEIEDRRPPPPTARDDKGRFTAPGSHAEGDAQAAAAEGAEADPSEKPAAAAAADDQTTDADPSKAPEAGAEAEADPDAPPVYSLGDLAKALEVDADDLAKHLTVDGPDGPVPLADVLTGWRAAPAVLQERTQLTEQRTQLEARAKALETRESEGLTRLATLTEGLIHELRGSEPNWSQLEQDGDETALFRARRSWEDRKQRVAVALHELESRNQARQAEWTESQKAAVAEQARILKEKMPEWRKPETFQAAYSEIESYLREVGYADEEIMQLADHRATIIAWEAAQFRKLRKGNRVLDLTKLRGKPRVLPPAPKAQAQRQSPDQKRQAAAVQRHRTERSLESAVGVIEGML